MRIALFLPFLLLVACEEEEVIEDGHSDATAYMTDMSPEVRFVGHSWWAPELLPWQAKNWCSAAYGDLFTEPICAQKVTLVPNGNVMWTHVVSEAEDAEVPEIEVEVEPWGTWQDAGSYDGFYAGWKYGVDGRTWTVWSTHSSEWDDADADRTVLAGGTWLTFTPAMD
jgi:hypothetical protein